MGVINLFRFIVLATLFGFSTVVLAGVSDPSPTELSLRSAHGELKAWFFHIQTMNTLQRAGVNWQKLEPLIRLQDGVLMPWSKFIAKFGASSEVREAHTYMDRWLDISSSLLLTFSKEANIDPTEIKGANIPEKFITVITKRRTYYLVLLTKLGAFSHSEILNYATIWSYVESALDFISRGKDGTGLLAEAQNLWTQFEVDFSQKMAQLAIDRCKGLLMPGQSTPDGSKPRN